MEVDRAARDAVLAKLRKANYELLSATLSIKEGIDAVREGHSDAGRTLVSGAHDRLVGVGKLITEAMQLWPGQQA